MHSLLFRISHWSLVFMLSSTQIWISSWKLVSTADIALQNMSILKMKTAGSSQTSVTTYETRRCHSPVVQYLLNVVKLSNLIRLRVSSALFTFFILGMNLYIYVLNNTSHINVTASYGTWYYSIIYGCRLATQQRPPTVTNAYFIGYHHRILWTMKTSHSVACSQKSHMRQENHTISSRLHD
jgi:hypothetical protein